jgi:hypothetical protein
MDPSLGSAGLRVPPAGFGSLPESGLEVDRAAGTRLWIYVYFFLLIFEGALRKWVFSGFPAISEALLLVRDPVAVIIYLSAWRANLLPKGIFLPLWGVSVLILSSLGLLQLFAIEGLLPSVVLFGVRTYCLHVPLVFILADVLRYEDLLRIGRWVLYLAGPMVALMLAQFLVPPDHFLNRGSMGLGAGGIGQIESAFGHVRPAGLFSYNTGATSFNLLVAAFWLYSFADGNWVSAPARWISGIALVCILPASGSRTFVLSFALLVIFSFVGGNFNARLLRVTLHATLVFTGIFCVLMFTDFFREGIAVFLSRWDDAADENGTVNNSIGMRFVMEFTDAFELIRHTPLYGKGLGLGSNVGSKLTIGDLDFLLAETEWARNVLEMGPIVAPLWLVARCAIAVLAFCRSWISLCNGMVLPWLLLGCECAAILNGSLAQPTSLGFIVFTTGLCLAAARTGPVGTPIFLAQRQRTSSVRGLSAPRY